MANSFIVNTVKTAVEGIWEDIKTYETVNLTVKAPSAGLNGTLYTLWGMQTVPGTTVELTRDAIPINLSNNQSIFLRVSAKSDWFMLILNGNGQIPIGTVVSTTYKTSLSPNVSIGASIVNGALKTIMYDTQGRHITSTDDNVQHRNGFQVHLDISTNNNVLSTALTSSVGTSAALNTAIAGTASTSNGGFFYSLTDVCGYPISSIKTANMQVKNAVEIAVADKTDRYYTSAFLPAFTNRSFNITLPGTINSSLVSAVDTQMAMLLLCVTNESADTIWIKVYDKTSTESLTETALIPRIVFNIPLLPFTSREISMDRGLLFNYGVSFRLTLDNTYSSAAYVSTGTSVYISGTYRRI